jgi:microcystin-dependent protein
MNIKTISSAVIVSAALLSVPSKEAAAGTDVYIGEIMWVPYAFCPRGSAEASGQLLSIASNTALFSLIGTTYGGDGRTTFALPDLRGRVPVHLGNGPGLSSYSLGETGGQEQVTLTTNQMPTHHHELNASEDAVDTDPAGSVLGSPKNKKIYDAPNMASTTLASSAMSDVGGSQPHENRPPYLTLRACIATVGIYPSRD